MKSPEELGERIAELQRRAEAAGRERDPGDRVRREARGCGCSSGCATRASRARCSTCCPGRRGRGASVSSTSSARWRRRGTARRSSTCRCRSRSPSTRSGSRRRRTRLTALRLALGGKLPGYEGRLGPGARRRLRGLGRVGQGRRAEAAGRAARPAARARGAVRGAHRDGEAPPLPVALLAGAARPRRHDRVRPLLVRARARRARGGVRDARGVGARLPDDRRLRAHVLRRGRRAREVLDARVRRGAAEAVREACRTTR